MTTATGAPPTGVSRLTAAHRLDSTARRAAEKILDQYYPELTAPVPLGLIVQRAGYRTSRVKHETTAVGFLIRDAAGNPAIGLNSRHGERHQRFALAHCFGHGELHENDLMICHELRTPEVQAGVGRSWPTDAEEQQATRFATELLMPAETVFDVARPLLDGQSNPDRIRFVKAMADVFDVSYEAMVFRLVDLAMIVP